jgi:prepilin-type N-terminal cleavage/methylation domain-containing protein
MSKFLRRPEGFTLIELMIVILIIAILVAIAVPVYLNARRNAQRRTCQANLRTVDSSVEAYEADTESLPTSIANMVAAGNKVLKTTPRCPVDTTADYTWVSGTPPSISCPTTSNHTI